MYLSSIVIELLPYFPEVDRIMPPKDDHVLISRTYEFVILHGKGELRLQIKLKMLIKWP